MTEILENQSFLRLDAEEVKEVQSRWKIWFLHCWEVVGAVPASGQQENRVFSPWSQEFKYLRGKMSCMWAEDLEMKEQREVTNKEC